MPRAAPLDALAVAGADCCAHRGAIASLSLPEAPPWSILASMIPEDQKPSRRRRKPKPLPGPLEHPVAPVPAWLRDASRSPASLEEASFIAGTALGALDHLVRRRQIWAGLWRQRLALASAATTVRRIGRLEDEEALRDAIHLTRNGDSVGPAGEMLLAWRDAVSLPPQDCLLPEALATQFQRFGRRDDDAVAVLADALADNANAGAISQTIDSFELVLRHSAVPEAAPFVSDLILARAFGWERAVPLIAPDVARGGFTRAISEEPAPIREERRIKLLSAYACAAIRAIDLSIDLGRKSERLLEAAPELRAKASGAVVEKLLSEDSLTASTPIVGITRWGMHRIFERLIAFGVLRELTGRSTFRIYGV
ncbi:DUF1403 family protein [Aquamicrobium zhengzhouense]|uniref:DUF1403 family protein n=1 Tax=Aquamicrobium zhengzhouense TaxID=2781738 RepID=A0ABS0SE54_9HYPH|nr:DUF1403 family protein [Aquamicrobium zhengzhouense]MBI1620996.1 DUF1403 family protein [Aquamicrobium zhengzhouense]